MSEAYEFVCSECRQRIVAIAGREQAPFDLCAQCLTLPGWFNTPELADILHWQPEPIDDPGTKPLPKE